MDKGLARRGQKERGRQWEENHHITYLEEMEALVKGKQGSLGATRKMQTEANSKSWEVNKDMEMAGSRAENLRGQRQKWRRKIENIDMALEQKAMAAEQLRDAR